ncbi:MAG: homoserine kinase [Candidatus Melainabacteria bacterium]|nr:MAG: homoserine kinase [Candidatus Melainabacteria bacterium]
MKVSVKVPATTANFGSGFDCFGMALPIYNIVTLEETVLPGTGVELNIVPEFQNNDMFITEHLPTDENNIAYKAIEMLYNSIGQAPSELKITIKSSIPIAKGLGSSASVIVGGLIAANELLNKPADEAALLSIAAEIEGHPDNVTPAFTGGLVLSSIEDDGSVFYRKMQWPEEWHLTIFIPDYELVTEISRSVLPSEVPMQDAIFDSRRTAMFVEALYTHDADLMKLALQDRLHQPYRAKLVPGLEDIVSALKHEENVIGCTLSGAGPAILVVSQKNNIEKIKSIVTENWANYNVKTSIYTVKPEEKGAEIIESV